jgi:predicted component of type VI protein secretion system
MTTAPEPTTWLLVPPSGDPIDVEGIMLLGRDPDHSLAEEATVIHCLDDPERTMSKTHALVWAEDAGLFIADLVSANGILVERDEDDFEVDSDEPFRLLEGDVVLLGEFALKVELDD